MKLAKMSLVTALLLGASVYAADNVEVSGNANLFYGTQSDALVGTDGGLFKKDSSYADFGFNVGMTADLMENVKAGGNVQVISTLGMKKGVASSTWSNGHLSNSGLLNTTEWVSDAWIEGKYANTTGKIGRMTLDTPLVFTETWSTDYNTFEAATIVNEDIPDTTLIGAYVANSNGVGTMVSPTSNVVAPGGVFKKMGSEGAYVIGATNNSIKPLTVQGWYYNLPSTLDAFWLQADVDYEGIIAGAQYTTINTNGGTDSDTAYAAKLGYAIPDIVTITAAYSSVDDKGDIGGVNNLATSRQAAGSASALYTEFWWWFGTSSASGADTMTLSAEGSVADVDLFLGLYSSQNSVTDVDTDEVTFTAGKSFGPVDTSIALIQDMFNDNGDKTDLTTIQLYFTYNF